MFAWERLQLPVGTWEITVELQGALWHEHTGCFREKVVVHVVDPLQVSPREAQQQLARSLHKLQHPSDCSSARALLFSSGVGGGIGALIHFAAYALLAAMETN